MKKAECAPKRTINCNIRLVNILFSNEFCSDLSKLGNKRDKNDLDEDKSSVDKFWDLLSEENLIEDKYRELVQQDEWFNYNSKHKVCFSKLPFRDGCPESAIHTS